MAFKNKIISNQVTGQSIRFLQTSKDTSGELLEMESTFQAHSVEPIPHYHPHQEEYFKVLSGEIKIRLNGNIIVLKRDETLHIPKNNVHSMWNDSNETALLNWKVKPAMDTEYLLETGIGLANDGKVNEKGMPSFLQSIMIAHKFRHVYRPAKPPYVILKFAFVLLVPIAWLFGYRGTYKKYLG